MYRAIKYFTDLQDNNYAYNGGDIFPRVGLEVSEDRFKELSSSANKRGEPVIEEIPDITEEITEDKPRKKRGRGKNADRDMSEN